MSNLKYSTEQLRKIRDAADVELARQGGFEHVASLSGSDFEKWLHAQQRQKEVIDE